MCSQPWRGTLLSTYQSCWLLLGNELTIHKCRDVRASHLWDWKRSFEALFVLKVAALLSGEGKPHVQCTILAHMWEDEWVQVSAGSW